MRAIEQALAIRPMTSREASATTGYARGYAKDLLSEMHKAGQVHIKSWVKNGRVWVRVYAFGPGRDSAKPAPMTKAESMRKYNERWRTLTRLRQRKEITPWTGLL